MDSGCLTGIWQHRPRRAAGQPAEAARVDLHGGAGGPLANCARKSGESTRATSHTSTLRYGQRKTAPLASRCIQVRLGRV